MICPRCRIPVRAHYRFCPSCGADLDAAGRGKLRYVPVLLLIAVAGWLLYARLPEWTSPRFVHKVSKIDQIPEPVSRNVQVDHPSRRTDMRSPVIPRAGVVSTYDITGRLMARIPAVVSGGGWVALPAEKCVGGLNWYFAPPGEAGVEIAGGVLGDGDEVGVWQLAAMDRFPGPPLFPAILDKSLQWMSLVSPKTDKIKHPTILSEQQNISRIALPETVGEPGILMQDGRLVGWTFADPARGYVWTGLNEDDLVMEMTVSDFYRLTFENSREEQFIRALALPESRPAQKLAAFAEGFRKTPCLSADDTPPHLTSAAAVRQMRDLMTRLVEEKWPYEVFRVFDAKILSGTGDPRFTEDVITLLSQTIGFDPALNILSDLLLDNGRNFSSRAIENLKAFQRELYLKWLLKLYTAGQFDAGWKIYGQAATLFPGDPDINLQGIRLALELKDWAAAERLIYAQPYPEEFSDQLREARARIEALKTPRRFIEIRFAPGSARVPADAVINSRVTQSFVVDTGSSMVTIPTQTAVKLGYDVNSAPLQNLMTASGMVRAPRITLDSIEVDGWVEPAVPAVVLDLPDKSGIGLLGLNFLDRFRMDLNSREGVLVLYPK